MDRPMTVREILLARLKSYEEEVRSGRHVPPPLSPELLRELEQLNNQESPPEC